MKTFRRLLAPALLLLVSLPLAAKDETALEATLKRAKELRQDYEYREAEKVLLRLLEIEPDCFDAVIGLARCAAGVGENPRAAALYRRAGKLEPDRPDPERGLGSLEIRLDRREAARAFFEMALTKAPKDLGSLAGLARYFIEEGEFEKADGLLTKAEGLGPNSTAVLSARAEHHFRQGRMTESARLLRRILEISPNNLGAHQRLANGFLELDRDPYEPPPVPRAYEEKVRAAARAYTGLDLDATEKAFAGLDTEAAPDGRPAFYRGLVDLRRGRPRDAIAHLRVAVLKEPESNLFRNALSAAYRTKIARQRAEYGGGADATDRMSPLAAELFPEEIPGLERIVRGYERLLPKERKVIARAARPLASYLPVLVEKGVTHDILGFETGMCEAPERRYLATRRTHDGRWYGALRGVGGRNAATGIEAILAAAELRYDTFAHELAHQVHRYGLSPADQKIVKRLYRNAKAEDLCLDYYAATNEREYLAQGYEAFVSLAKSPFHHSLRRHDRAELLARDPALYRFLLRMTKTATPDPTLAPLVPRILAFYEWTGDLIRIARVRALFAPHLTPAPEVR